MQNCFSIFTVAFLFGLPGQLFKRKSKAVDVHAAVDNLVNCFLFNWKHQNHILSSLYRK